MGYPTPIEWTDATWNPVGGCSIKSPGCNPCYAMKLAAHPRLNKHPLYAGTTDIVKGKAVWNGTLTILPDEHPGWTWPRRWRGAKEPKLGPGKPSLIFVGAMTDIFHEDTPVTHIHRVLSAIGLSRHIGQYLTNRPDVMAEAVRSYGDWRSDRGKAAQPYLWLGFSAEDQTRFDERWPHMRVLAELGFTVFVSYEPARGPLVLPADFLALGNRAQLIAGGASGSEAWPAHPDWFRAVRDQCTAAGVAFFFKQWGEWAEVNPGPNHRTVDWYDYARNCPDPDPDDLVRRGDQFISLDGHIVRHRTQAKLDVKYRQMRRIGREKAGRLLDGREWNEFPT